MNDKQGLFIFNDDLDMMLDNLQPDEVVELLKMLNEYNRVGEYTESDNRIIRVVFASIKRTIDRKNEFLEKQRANGSKGGRPRKSEKTSETQPMSTDSIDDTEETENPKKPKITQNNPTKPNESLSKYKYKDKYKHKDKYISPPTPSERGDREPIDTDPIDLDDTSGVVIDMQTINQSNQSGDKQQLGALFDKFWNEYPRKEDKTKAKKAFIKLRPDKALVGEMLNALKWQKTMEQWRDRRYIPLPTTYLNGRRWEDEQPAQTTQPARSGQPGYADELVAQGISPF